ncbi:MAG: tetratricopeptide repeat protein [Candidatus Cloacimonetes bacterium]|nr:tetratricopeptide repeat protein [Candidatus Cloacimonadota bacterium]
MFRKLLIIALITCAVPAVLFAQMTDRDIQQIEYDAGTAYNEGVELYSQKDYQGAIDKFVASLELYKKIDTEANPKTDRIRELYKNLSVMYYTTKQYPKAIEYYKLRQDYEPDNYQIAISLCSIYEAMGQKDQALTVLVEYDKDYDEYKISKKIASIYEEDNDLPNAIIYYTDAFNLNPKKVEYLEKIALFYHKTGETENAIKAYEDYIATEPADYILRKVYKNLGIFYQNMGQIDKAILAFENSLALKSDKDIAFTVGHLYYDQGEYAQSKQYLQDVLSIDQNNPQAHYYMGKIYREEEQWDKAIAQFKLIVNDPQLGKFAKEEIDYIEKQK